MRSLKTFYILEEVEEVIFQKEAKISLEKDSDSLEIQKIFTLQHKYFSIYRYKQKRGLHLFPPKYKLFI